MMKNYCKYCAYTIILYSLVGIILSCNRSGSGSAEKSGSILTSEKPWIDTSLVLDQFDLYRSKRYEGFEDAISAGPENVYKLVLWGQKLGKISSEIGRLKNLQTLDMAYNDLIVLPDEIEELHYLQGIYANGNKLTEFPEQLILLPVLNRIDLSENLIREIPEEIVRMDQLKRLSLDKNSISAVPKELFKLTNLSVLEMAENDIEELSGEIGKLVNLKKLDLANNQLLTIPKELTVLFKTLEELNIQGNQIPREDIEFLIEAMPGTNVRY